MAFAHAAPRTPSLAFASTVPRTASRKRSAEAMENLGPVLQGIVGRVEDLEDFTGAAHGDKLSNRRVTQSPKSQATRKPQGLRPPLADAIRSYITALIRTIHIVPIV